MGFTETSVILDPFEIINKLKTVTVRLKQVVTRF